MTATSLIKFNFLACSGQGAAFSFWAYQQRGVRWRYWTYYCGLPLRYTSEQSSVINV
jgi:hypothetical protein